MSTENIDLSLLAELGTIDTPTVCNALEIVAPERRAKGFTVYHLHCARPDLPPMVGFARTATIRAMQSGQPKSPDEGRAAREGYYGYIDDGPKPAISVVQDLDSIPGFGSMWGEVNSNIHKGLGCLGCVTNGSVRDLPDLADDFQFLTGMVGPSHAHVHTVDYACQVNVAGMVVNDGDIIHADQHGAVVIPANVADKVMDAARLIAKREAVIISAAKQPGFDLEKLKASWAGSAEIH